MAAKCSLGTSVEAASPFRAARYWVLVGTITNMVPTPEQQKEIGLYPWLIEALRAMVARTA